MEQFLKAVAMAWNPVGEIRRRFQSDELDLPKTIAPFVGIAIACLLFRNTATAFFLEILALVTQDNVPEHPLIGTFAQQMLGIICLLGTTLPVAILPRAAFSPNTRSAVLSAILIICASGAFYEAAFSCLASFISGAVLATNLKLGLIVDGVLSGLTGLVVIVLLATFWIRSMVGILRLSAGQVTLISIAAVSGFGVVLAFVLLLARAV